MDLAGQVRPVVAVWAAVLTAGALLAFNKLWMELTALERRAFEKRMATALILIKWPCGTPNRKQIVAGQIVLPAPAVINSRSYKQGPFHKLWLELR